MSGSGDDEGADPGVPPDAPAIAELLVERYSIPATDRLSVEVIDDPESPGLALTLERGKDRYQIRIEYLRGRAGRDVWMLLADALDALFGTLIESDRAYRDLPTGSDVEFVGAFFRVDVQRTIPELIARADHLLEGNGKH
jgi:hypothetical protein